MLPTIVVYNASSDKQVSHGLKKRMAKVLLIGLISPPLDSE